MVRGIGVFDSGFGGLTVVRQLLADFPGVDLIYFGDTARVPYGSKTSQQIMEFNEEIISFLFDRGAGLILMGCNTSSSLAIDRDREIFDRPVFALIEPTARALAGITRNNIIGVLATQATVNSGTYTNKICKYNPAARVTEVPCPDFVPLVESGQFTGPRVEAAVSKYLTPILNQGADTVVYGCTHYPFLEKTLKKFAGDRVNFVDPAFYIVQEARPELKLMPAAKKPARQFFTTGSVEKFRDMSRTMLGDIMMGADISQITLEELSRVRADYFKQKGFLDV